VSTIYMAKMHREPIIERKTEELNSCKQRTLYDVINMWPIEWHKPAWNCSAASFGGWVLDVGDWYPFQNDY